jgi:hypothetical protein
MYVILSFRPTLSHSENQQSARTRIEPRRNEKQRARAARIGAESTLPNESFRRRFTDLEAQSQRFPVQMSTMLGPFYLPGDYLGWATGAQSLIRAVFGEDSPHHANFATTLKGCKGSKSEVDALKAVFLSAKEAFDGGYVFNVELTVSGEVFGNFVATAKQALSGGYKDVAAVLACAALEDTLKRYAIANSLTVEGKTMQDIVGALKSKGLVTGAQKSLLDPMPKIRDYAMHANWDKITAPDVNSVIGYVEQFLLTHFSGP